MFWKYTPKIKKAIKFSIKTHEVYQKQKRKGKDIAYISHPLTVGLILSLAGAKEEVIVAGILHDTIEDSVDEKKVDEAMLKERFGEDVAKLVLSVTETDKSLPWEERKKLALEHIKKFPHDSLLVKSADIISNTSELIDDYNKNGEQIFDRFNGPKDKILQNYLKVIGAIVSAWDDNPLKHDLTSIAGELQMIGAKHFMVEEPATVIEYGDYDENEELKCSVCGWKGLPKGHIEYYDQLFDVSCPVCDKMLLVVSYPKVESKKAKMDLSKYKTVGEWYKEYHDRFPVQVPAALTKVMKQYNLSLEEAYKFLVEKGAIIEIDYDEDES